MVIINTDWILSSLTMFFFLPVFFVGVELGPHINEQSKGDRERGRERNIFIYDEDSHRIQGKTACTHCQILLMKKSTIRWTKQVVRKTEKWER